MIRGYERLRQRHAQTSVVLLAIQVFVMAYGLAECVSLAIVGVAHAEAGLSKARYILFAGVPLGVVLYALVPAVIFRMVLIGERIGQRVWEDLTGDDPDPDD